MERERSLDPTPILDPLLDQFRDLNRALPSYFQKDNLTPIDEYKRSATLMRCTRNAELVRPDPGTLRVSM